MAKNGKGIRLATCAHFGACVLSCALVVTALFAVRRIGSAAYDEYRSRGGEKGFWTWFAKDACGLPLPGTIAADDEDGIKGVRRKLLREARKLEAEKRAAQLKAEAEERRRAQARKGRKGGTTAKAGAGKGKRAAKSARRSGGRVKVGGGSSYVAGGGKTPYRVAGIRGIEFGSSDNAPGEGVKPILSVTEDSEGNMHFQGLKWRENKGLSEPVYGFERAYLSHSYDTEQLSSVTFYKNFPFTEEGLKQATEFYGAMSAEASKDLGFEVVDVDRTGNLKSATVCEFRNRDGDTSIHGAINAYNDKHLTVTFSVSDNEYSTLTRSQSNQAYESGVADSVDARIEVVNRDHTAQKQRVNDFLCP